MYDYANILFTGKSCNSRCYECIGNRPELGSLPTNLRSFPIRNIDGLIREVNQHSIRDLAFTGTNVDPQLYLHEGKLISYLRERLTSKTNLSLHTNGLLAVRKIDTFNQYDKASISFPSFNPDTYQQVTRRKQPDIEGILQESVIPTKLSMLITPFNQNEINDYISRSADLGIKRIVVRKLKDREEEFPVEEMQPFGWRSPSKFVFGWPVYEMHGVEVTICGFDHSTANGLFLFSNGELKNHLLGESVNEIAA